jgi:hypothetical protein
MADIGDSVNQLARTACPTPPSAGVHDQSHGSAPVRRTGGWHSCGRRRQQPRQQRVGLGQGVVTDDGHLAVAGCAGRRNHGAPSQKAQHALGRPLHDRFHIFLRWLWKRQGAEPLIKLAPGMAKFARALRRVGTQGEHVSEFISVTY